MALLPKEKLSCRLWWVLVWLLIWLPGVLGCQRVPSAKARAGSSSITQTGPAAVPAKAETQRATVTLPLPAGTRIEIPSRRAETGAAGSGDAGDLGTSPEVARIDAAVSITLPSPSVLTVDAVSEAVTGPQAFAPPSPPSPAEKATGWAVIAYYAALPIGLIAAGIGVWRMYPLVIVGGLLTSGAAAFGLFVAKNPWVERLMGAGVVVALLGVCLWHFWLKKRLA